MKHQIQINIPEFDTFEDLRRFCTQLEQEGFALNIAKSVYEMEVR